MAKLTGKEYEDASSKFQVQEYEDAVQVPSSDMKMQVVPSCKQAVSMYSRAYT